MNSALELGAERAEDRYTHSMIRTDDSFQALLERLVTDRLATLGRDLPCLASWYVEPVQTSGGQTSAGPTLVLIGRNGAADTREVFESGCYNGKSDEDIGFEVAEMLGAYDHSALTLDSP
jgi:hypothetical protein